MQDCIYPAERYRSAWIARNASPWAPLGTGLLDGQVLAVKDNIDVAGVPTTAGSRHFQRLPVRSATVVTRLLEAGARYAGKTNLDQFACGLNGTRSPFGVVANTFDPRYVSGGSSSGSAVVVALGEADLALGTDTAGSGRVPAAFNNIVGIKPSRGLLPCSGVVPASPSFDCVSVFAPTVAAAMQAVQIAAGFDAADPASRRRRLDPAFMPMKFEFAVPREDQLEFFDDRLAADAFAGACSRLEQLGGRRRAIDFEPFRRVAAMLYEAAFVAERYAAIREFFDAHDSTIEPSVRAIIARGRAYGAADLVEAWQQLGRLRAQCEAAIERADVLVVPTAPALYTIEQMLADPIELNRRLGLYTNFVNLLDQAAIAVPAAIRPDGLPFGITMIGPACSELRLGDLAQRFHHACGLPAGATNRALPPPHALHRDAGSVVQVAVVGAHLSGMPLNGQLLERGARLVAQTRTAPEYRLFALTQSTPPKPALLRVGPGEGAAIDLEVWELPADRYGSFVALIPGPLGIGTLRLIDGTQVQGFVCEQAAIQGCPDITSFRGWRAYVASLQSRS